MELLGDKEVRNINIKIIILIIIVGSCNVSTNPAYGITESKLHTSLLIYLLI